MIVVFFTSYFNEPFMFTLDVRRSPRGVCRDSLLSWLRFFSKIEFRRGVRAAFEVGYLNATFASGQLFYATLRRRWG